jgi:hypothetical protein
MEAGLRRDRRSNRRQDGVSGSSTDPKSCSVDGASAHVRGALQPRICSAASASELRMASAASDREIGSFPCSWRCNADPERLAEQASPTRRSVDPIDSLQARRRPP